MAGPIYTYAGANAGGQMLFTCPACGALLQETNQTTHTAWHSALDVAMAAMQASEAVQPTPATEGEQ